MVKQKKRFKTDLIAYNLFQIVKECTIVLSVATIIALYKGHKLIAEVQTPKWTEQSERIPIMVQFKHDLENMEVPEYLLEEAKDEVDEKVDEVATEELYDDDIWLLAQVMHAEEGVFYKYYKKDPSLTELVYKMAGSVVMHRKDIQYLGATTIKEVIFAKGQYAKQTQNRVTEGQEIPEVVYKWAQELLTDGPLGPRGMIYQAEFVQSEVYMEIGNQKFCVEPKYN